MALAGCQKELPPFYGDSHVAYLDGAVWQGSSVADTLNISFLDVLEPEAVVELKVMTRGRVDFENDRTFKVVVLDSVPAAPYVRATEDEYELGEMVVPAGKEYGMMKITLKDSERLTTEGARVQLALGLVPSADYPAVGNKVVDADGVVNFYTMYVIRFSNLLEEPPLWNSWAFWSNWPGFAGAPPAYDAHKHQLLLDACVEVYGNANVLPWQDGNADGDDYGMTYTNDYGVVTTFVFAQARGNLAVYKANSEADPVTYPPYYDAGTTNWITL